MDGPGGADLKDRDGANEAMGALPIALRGAGTPSRLLCRKLLTSNSAAVGNGLTKPSSSALVVAVLLCGPITDSAAPACSIRRAVSSCSRCR